MAKKKKSEERVYFWDGIDEKDFLRTDNIVEEDIVDVDTEMMLNFLENINVLRHLPRESDGLKPVERRIMNTIYEFKTFHTEKPKKSNVIATRSTESHPHGEGSVYSTLAGMTMPWKCNIPIVRGIGNMGNDADPNSYAAMRYTEVKMSKYGYNCFFKDYRDDCIETIFNTAKDNFEPLSLPSRYPNLLINGGYGISNANQYAIPCFNVEDVVNLTKRLIDNPDDPDIYIIPDLPSGCDIIDNGQLRDLCDLGEASFRMRAKIDIDGSHPKKWVLTVSNLPWLANLPDIMVALAKMAKKKELPIDNIYDDSEGYTVTTEGIKIARSDVKLKIEISKAYDPYVIRELIYKKTSLDKAIAAKFKIITDDLEVKVRNIRELVLNWIDNRKEYKRRRINREISEVSARIVLLEALIDITSSEEKCIAFAKANYHCKDGDAFVQELCSRTSLNSYQAAAVSRSGIKALNKYQHDNFVKEYNEKKAHLQDLEIEAKMNNKQINQEIKKELDELKEYYRPRQSEVIKLSTETIVANTNHYIVTTAQGYIKKLPYNADNKRVVFGSFKDKDYPKTGIIINNMESMMIFDSMGRYSIIPVSELSNTDPSEYGNRVYSETKLNGSIVSMMEYMSTDTRDYILTTLGKEIYVVTLTRDGLIKRTHINEYIGSGRTRSNSKALTLKDGDELIYASLVFSDVNLLVYTKNGEYSHINSDEITALSKDSMGTQAIKLLGDDACVGIAIIGNTDTDILVVTEKGCMKKCSLEYFGQAGKRKLTSYLATLEAGDSIKYVSGLYEKNTVNVVTRLSTQAFDYNDIEEKARKAKCPKAFPVPLGDMIINVTVQ